MKVREVAPLLERNGWKETRSRAATDIQTSRSGQPGDSARQRWQRARAGHAQRYTQKGRLEMRERRYPIVIERTATGFSASSRDVPGCASAGDTEEDTRSNLREALAAHFEAMREIGESIPEPSSLVDYVEVAA
jgi:predicted RNase H-like HicB family nuclease